MAARLLMIGLDGADARRIDRHSADGSLPHLAALRARGEARQLHSPPGITDDAIWASFQYGEELGEHGRYHYCLPLRDGHLGMAHEEERDRSTFWDDLSSQGTRVAVIDVPKCRDPRPIDGVHLVDWLVHGRYFHLGPRSQPPSLAGEIVDRFGPAPPSRCDYGQPPLSDPDVRDIVHNLRTSVARKRAAGLHYLQSDEWGLFLVAFKEAHCAGHAFWDFEAEHPDHDPARSARLEDPMMAVLRDLDEAVGDFVAAAGPSAQVVVFCTTTYEANGSLDHLMPGIVKRLNSRLSGRGRGLVGRLFGRWRLPWLRRPNDWRCTLLPYNENCAALRVDRARGKGIADLGNAPDPRQLLFIEAQLEALRDVDTGQRVVTAISRPSSEFDGSRARTLPDLLVHYASGRFPRAVVSSGLGRIAAHPRSMRPGNHLAGGFAIAAGDRVSPAISDVETVADLGKLVKNVLAAGSA